MNEILRKVLKVLKCFNVNLLSHAGHKRWQATEVIKDFPYSSSARVKCCKSIFFILNRHKKAWYKRIFVELYIFEFLDKENGEKLQVT